MNLPSVQSPGTSLIVGGNSTFDADDFLRCTDWGTLVESGGVAPAFESAIVSGGVLALKLRAKESSSHIVGLSAAYFERDLATKTAPDFGVRFRVRCVLGEPVEFFIGKTLNESFAFTPTNEWQTVSGSFRVTTENAGTLYIALRKNADANGSKYEFDDIELFHGVTKVNSFADAPDCAKELESLVRSLRNGEDLTFDPGRMYRTTRGNLELPENCTVDLRGSEIQFDIGSRPDDGFLLAHGCAVKRGHVSMKVNGYEPNNRNFQTPVRSGFQQNNFLINSPVAEDILISSNASGNDSYGILFCGTRNHSIKRVRFKETDGVRRLVCVVWAGPDRYSPTVGTVPSYGEITDIYSDNCRQGFPDSGGGCVVGVNGIASTMVARVFGRNCGRSLVTVSPGDAAFDNMRPEYQIGGNGPIIVEGCVQRDGGIGVRITGKVLGDTVRPTRIQVAVRNCNLHSDTRYQPVLIEDGVSGLVVVEDNILTGGKNSILVDGSNERNSGIELRRNIASGFAEDSICVIKSDVAIL